MRYEGGKVVEASATSNEEALISELDRDEGARMLGEYGIGCNAGIQRYMKNTRSTRDVRDDPPRVGAGFPTIGGKNVSAVHWDMVRDLRNGGRDRVRRRGRAGKGCVDVLTG